MDSGLLFGVVMLATAVVFVLWVLAVKRQMRLRRERRLQRRVNEHLAFEQRLNAARRQGQG